MVEAAAESELLSLAARPPFLLPPCLQLRACEAQVARGLQSDVPGNRGGGTGGTGSIAPQPRALASTAGRASVCLPSLAPHMTAAENMAMSESPKPSQALPSFRPPLWP